MQHKYIVSSVIGVLIVFLFYQSIFSFSTASAQNDNANSTIAGINITVDKELDIQALLASEIQQWKEQPLIVQGQSAIVEVPTQYIQFDITETVGKYMQAIKNPWYKPWAKVPGVHIPLDVTLSDELKTAFINAPLFNVDETIEAIREHASELKTTPVVAEEISFSKDMMKRVSFEIQEIHGNSAKLSSLATELNETTIMAGETFSFLNTFNDDLILRDEESVNFFASVLYSVVLQAYTSIQERHSQHNIPNYLQPGIEVEVSERLQRDFAFENEGQSPMIFVASVENGRLLIELYALENNLDISYSVKKIEVKPRTIYRLSPDLQVGEEKVLQNGSSGYRVAVYKKIADQASYEAEQQISRDFYPPQHRIVLVSSKEELEDTAEIENEEQGSNIEANKDSNHNTIDDKQDKDNDGVKDSTSNKEVKYDKGGNIITDQEE
ncbi:VanW family protein [Sporosarcina ureilytica]|uniref:G5 domain-containing protein n=1 Tax=Sporosarcina ureilytica TaxID=298596 RepID=A0A1D8JFV8_9BACL|nr:VanW family protein [Sporosarcina ureilytica]AOV07596.1 hypothetical protein BI350_08650 [Sporosarcina ureilytica]